MLAKARIGDNINVVVWYNYELEMEEVGEVEGVASYVHLSIIRATLTIRCPKTKRTTQLYTYAILSYTT